MRKGSTPAAPPSICRTRRRCCAPSSRPTSASTTLPLDTKDHGFLWFDVAKVDPARDRPFDEVKDAVEKQWRADEVSKALSAKAADLVKQIDAGASVASLAQAAGVEAKSAADIRRRGGASLAANVVAAIFAPAAGQSGIGLGSRRTARLQDHFRYDAAL